MQDENTIKSRKDILYAQTKGSISELREIIKKDPTFCDETLRSICWQAFLLPTSDSLQELDKIVQKERIQYSKLKFELITCCKHPQEEVGDLSLTHPLSLHESNPWRKFFEDEELRKVIDQDVNRAFPEDDYFRKESTQLHLMNILFIYSKINKDLSYRQGMHELLGVILKVLDEDSSSLEFLEHDSFSLFQALMSRMKFLFAVDQELQESPITKLCRKIQFDDLPIVDCILAKHLERLQVEPTMYAIRWIRILFTSEFRDVELLHLWDGIFSLDSTLKVVPYIVLVMLIQIRDELLRSNFNGIITKIIRYKCPSPLTLVEEALSLMQNTTQVSGANLIRKYSTFRIAESSTSSSSSSPHLQSNSHSRLNSKESLPDTAKNVIARSSLDKTTFFTFDDGWKTASDCWTNSTIFPGAEDLRMHTYRKDAKERRFIRERDEILGEILDLGILKLRGSTEERRDAIAGIMHVRDVLHNETSLDTDLLQRMKDKRNGKIKIWIPPHTYHDRPQLQNAMTIEGSPMSTSHDDLYSYSWKSTTKGQAWIMGDEDDLKLASRST